MIDALIVGGGFVVFAVASFVVCMWPDGPD